jgi:hypothetical protein
MRQKRRLVAERYWQCGGVELVMLVELEVSGFMRVPFGVEP